MPANVEREIKLRFDSPATARAAVVATGAIPLAGRRLQQNSLLDTADGYLQIRGSTLRLRTEDGRSILTFKGPVQPATMKVREEIETDTGDAALLLSILARIGFDVWFRYEKYREEFTNGGVVIAVDETPAGTFVELEGSEPEIAALSVALGRGPADYVLDSYQGVFARYCEERGLPVTDMLFDRG